MPRNKRRHQQAELEEELLDCVRRGNLDRVRELVLIRRVNVNCSDEYDQKALHQAIGGGHAHVARFLLENGADVDAADMCDWTALGYAILEDSIALAELLLEYGAGVEKPCSDESPLVRAIVMRRVGMVRLLLRSGATTDETLYRGNKSHYSALYVACNSGSSAEIVQLLLDQDDGVGVNSFVPSLNGFEAMSPLCAVCRRNKLENAQVLIQNGARVIFPLVYPDNPCPLVHAVEHGSLELVRYLLDNSPFSVSANAETTAFSVVDGTHPLTAPLRSALKEGKFEVAQLLVDRGADVDDGSLLCLVARKRLYAGVRFLLGNGANVNQADTESGKTPLWISADHGNVKLVKEFLKAGANLDVRDKNGETPLGVAYRKGHKSVVYLLLRTSPHVWSKLAGAF